MEVNGQLHAPAGLPQGKKPQYPLDRKLIGPHSRFGRGDEEKKYPPPGKEPRLFSPLSQSLHWLCYPGYNLYMGMY